MRKVWKSSKAQIYLKGTILLEFLKKIPDACNYKCQKLLGGEWRGGKKAMMFELRQHEETAGSVALEKE